MKNLIVHVVVATLIVAGMIVFSIFSVACCIHEP